MYILRALGFLYRWEDPIPFVTFGPINQDFALELLCEGCA